VSNSWFSTDEEREQAVTDLKTCGRSAIRLLAQSIEHQELRRVSLSKAAEDLNSCGFLFIKEVGIFTPEYELAPSLWGEEALELLEQQR
jgi:hypothetical protein